MIKCFLCTNYIFFQCIIHLSVSFLQVIYHYLESLFQSIHCSFPILCIIGLSFLDPRNYDILWVLEHSLSVYYVFIFWYQLTHLSELRLFFFLSDLTKSIPHNGYQQIQEDYLDEYRF